MKPPAAARCLRDVRWLLILLAACGSPPPRPALSAYCATPRLADTTRGRERDFKTLVELPPLPAKRGALSCSTDVERAVRIRIEPFEDQQLVRHAIARGGDCRIEVDAHFASYAPYRIGGCTGASADEALRPWTLVAAVASTPARRAAALRNVAALAWRLARYGENADAWIEAGDRYLAAIEADPNTLELSLAAVAAYEHAIRVSRDRDQIAKITRRLAQIVDGAAADRARALRQRYEP